MSHESAEGDLLPFGDMSDHAKQLLVDAFGRVRERVIDLTDRLTDDIATYRPDPEANSIAWLIWHLSRIQDDHVADLAGVEQVWAEWRERFGLPFSKWATGYGQGPKEVAAVRTSGDLLGGYHRAVHDLTLRYLDGITAEELDRIVDTRWDPPVTAAVRLVSVVGDTMQHLGQAAYVRGLAERRDSAWHQAGTADR
jgi:DinB superfamily